MPDYVQKKSQEVGERQASEVGKLLRSILGGRAKPKKKAVSKPRASEREEDIKERYHRRRMRERAYHTDPRGKRY